MHEAVSVHEGPGRFGIGLESVQVEEEEDMEVEVEGEAVEEEVGKGGIDLTHPGYR